MSTRLPLSGEQVGRVRLRAFSLIELLAVVAIFIILMTFSITAWNSVTQGMHLAGTASSVSDAIAVARQEASGKNREVRLVAHRELFEGTNAIRAFQLEEILPDGQTNSLARKIRIPESIVVRETDSPLLANQLNGWEGFYFRPGGLLPPDADIAQSYLTLSPKNFAGPQPANFIVLQVNPTTGRVQTYQP